MTKAGTGSDKFDYTKEGRWLELITYPGWLGVVFSLDAYREVLKRDKHPDWKTATWIRKDAQVDYFLSNNLKEPFYVIKLDLNRKPNDPRLIGLIVHEVMHVVQQIWIDIGEEDPGREAEAYLIQIMTQFVVKRYQEAYRFKKSRKS